ncbi:hypothetical protein [Pseudidiomarina terrestris]|uniref:Signaling protein n=1 Tax=Pseudidiomarina terrestris TaxID=2820060 RepID=A0ABT8MK47_9GAMM|nr:MULTISPECIES: hypothetical protein [unclassified Pseudidiomarina]MDN7130332.1 hypothetical protein [Pseudidiomarina sp. 1APR75-15]MDN7136255.1 hypothetical protein [Pseudidiomarina sp. 1ASP75-5]MDN7138828.1 hypothetical protein [Pseudidiomarina sp. 1ASP75-14]
MPKVPFLRMRPVVLSIVVMVLLALAWLPTGNFLPGERTNKPQLHVSYRAQDDVPRAEDIIYDLQQRIGQRHEWLLTETSEAYAWDLDIEVSQSSGQVVIHGVLTQPGPDASSAQEQRFKIQGPVDAVGALPEQFVKVLIDLVENAENYGSSL